MPVDLSGVELSGVERVLVKFYFTNPKLWPEGISLKPRNEEKLEKRHWEAGLKLGLPEGGIGRIRPGRVDTGVHLLEEQNVDLRPIWEELRKFRVVDIHGIRSGFSEKKNVVVVTFASAAAQPEIKGRKEKVVKQVEEIFVKGSIWGFVHIWKNPDRTLTINCVHRVPRQAR